MSKVDALSCTSDGRSVYGAVIDMLRIGVATAPSGIVRVTVKITSKPEPLTFWPVAARVKTPPCAHLAVKSILPMLPWGLT